MATPPTTARLVRLLPFGARQHRLCRRQNEGFGRRIQLIHDVVHRLRHLVGRMATQILRQRLRIQLTAGLLRASCLTFGRMKYCVRKGDGRLHTMSITVEVAPLMAPARARPDATSAPCVKRARLPRARSRTRAARRWGAAPTARRGARDDAWSNGYHEDAALAAGFSW